MLIFSRSWIYFVSKSVLFPTCHRVLLNKIVKLACKDAKGNVLVLGSGAIDYSRFMCADRVNTVTSVDMYSESSVVNLRCDAAYLPFRDECFDTILCFEVFEHVHKLDLSIAEILRVLKTKGKLSATIPFMFHVHGDPCDYRRLTSYGIEESFKEFSQVRCYRFGGRVVSVWDLVCGVKVMVPFRLFNNLLRLVQLNIILDTRCPSGYFFTANK